MLETRKVVLIGTGFVGMSMAYSLMNTGGIDELILVDIDDRKAQGEAMDISDGLPHAKSHMSIRAGHYKDCQNADIVVICAGINQKVGQTRLELAKTNRDIMIEITRDVIHSGFQGIFIVASNPVDYLCSIVQNESKFPHYKVIGTGTILDTARLRMNLSQKLNISYKNIHAYVLGEHGDSSFIAWSHAFIGCTPLHVFLEEHGHSHIILEHIAQDVRDAAYEIIEKKKATYYGIGLSLNRLIQMILDDERGILTVSAYNKQQDIYIGMPALIGKRGVIEVFNMDLNESEYTLFNKSCQKLKNVKIMIEEA